VWDVFGKMVQSGAILGLHIKYNQAQKPKTIWLGIRIFCPSGVPSLPADCYFNEIVLIKKNTTKSVGLVQSRHHHLIEI
jgi:hypothetical protein